MSAIDQALRDAAAAHPIPGFVAAAVKDGTRIFEGAYGPRGPANPAPMSLDAVFWIASMTKAVTAVAAMQLVEAGRIGLDEPLGGRIPYLGEIQVLEGFDAQGAPRLRSPKNPVTLRHLLTHTSGLGYDMWNPSIAEYMAKAGVPSLGTGLDAALRLPLMADPGEQWEYGIGIDWAGKVVEAVSGQALDVYLAQHVFAPLGMADTAFLPTPAMQARQAGLAMRTPDGGLAPFDLPLNAQPEFWGGGGGLYSTLGDYLAFLQMILDGGAAPSGQVLKPETVALMSRNHIGDLPVRRLTTAMPFLTHDLDITDGAPAHWGLSWQINPEPGPHGRAAGSLAWAGLANTYYWIDPQSRVAGLIMTQMLPFADPAALAVLGAFERAVYAEIRA